MTTQTLSITKLGTVEPFDLQVARGQITGHQSIFRSAYSSFVSNAGTRAIWNRAAAYTFPAAAASMTISSSSAADVGQQVLVSGLDANYNPISVTAPLNGQSGVMLVQSFLRINDVIVIAPNGSLAYPVGDIYVGNGTVTAGVPANVYGFVSAGDQQSLTGVYTVPAGYTLYITGGSVNTAGLAVNVFMTVDFHASVIPNGSAQRVDYLTARIFASNGFQFFPYSPPTKVPEKTDIYDTVLGSVAGPDRVTASFTGILVKNDGAL